MSELNSTDPSIADALQMDAIPCVLLVFRVFLIEFRNESQILNSNFVQSVGIIDQLYRCLTIRFFVDSQGKWNI